MSSSIGADGVSDQAVTTERDGHVLVITLHRPEVRNAIDGALAAGLDAALQHLDDDVEQPIALRLHHSGFRQRSSLRAVTRLLYRE